jgi:chromosome segregation ATPase
MIIKNIEVKGSGKPVAALEFQRGLNVVAGASDTGKSYVVECIQFILGASDVPKSIDESAGYDYLEVTFQEDDGSQFRLQRKLAPKADTLLMQDGSDEVIVLKGKHRKGFDNLSNWFLARLKLNDKLLLKSKENLTTQALTLRTLENIFVIDEARIVAKYSPLGKGQLIDRTLEMSFLKTLLTGEDDSDAKELKVNKESKAAIAKKMVSLEELIEKLYPVQDGGEQEIGKIDEEIEQLEEQLELIS